MILVGIDPGKNGALAVKRANSTDVFDLPTKPHGKKTVISGAELFEQLQLISPDIVVLERVGAMPRDAGSSAFSFGRCYGTIEAILDLIGADVHYVTPQVWKRRTRTPTSKEGALQRARELYPEVSSKLSRKKDHDRAEALMMVNYAETYLAQET